MDDVVTVRPFGFLCCYEFTGGMREGALQNVLLLPVIIKMEVAQAGDCV